VDSPKVAHAVHPRWTDSRIHKQPSPESFADVVLHEQTTPVYHAQRLSINAAFCANQIVGPVVWPTASARIAGVPQTIRRSPVDSARAVTSAIADAVVVSVGAVRWSAEVG